MFTWTLVVMFISTSGVAGMRVINMLNETTCERLKEEVIKEAGKKKIPVAIRCIPPRGLGV